MKKRLLLFTLFLSFGFGFSQTKDSLSVEEQERRKRNIEAGNPFKEFGYTPKIATLSQGKYLEWHDLDSIVKIGSYLYHVKKKEITGYKLIDPNNLEDGLSPVIISRWLSPDPLAEEFPSWSPYNYVMNNPVRMTDPTGLAPNDIVFNIVNDDCSVQEIARIETDIEVEFNIDASKIPLLDFSTHESITLGKDDFDVDNLFDLQAVSFDLSGEAAAKLGVQVELSFIGMIDGPDKGEWGIALQTNGLAGFEGGGTASFSFYESVEKGGKLFLTDLRGVETGIQGSAGYVNASYFQGLTSTSSFPFIKPVYNGFSIGATSGVMGTSISGSGYIGVSDFLYRSNTKD